MARAVDCIGAHFETVGVVVVTGRALSTICEVVDVVGALIAYGTIPAVSTLTLAASVAVARHAVGTTTAVRRRRASQVASWI